MKETIIQFGSGNFLRGFANHFIHIGSYPACA